MIRILAQPIEVITVDGDEQKKVFKFCEGENYTKSFSYEWSHYSKTQIDSHLGKNLSKSRLELNLGFPLEFLSGMNVLEIGCGFQIQQQS